MARLPGAALAVLGQDPLSSAKGYSHFPGGCDIPGVVRVFPQIPSLPFPGSALSCRELTPMGCVSQALSRISFCLGSANGRYGREIKGWEEEKTGHFTPFLSKGQP